LICRSKSEAWIGVAIGLMGLAVLANAILAFQTRKLPICFREAKYINLIAYNTIVIGTITIVVCAVLYKLSAIGFFLVISLGIIFMSAVFWGLLFLPKFYVVLLKSEKDTKYSSNMSLGLDNSTTESHSSKNRQEDTLGDDIPEKKPDSEIQISESNALQSESEVANVSLTEESESETESIH